MNPLAAIRSGQARWGPRPLGVLLLVWLNLALQPCAAALAAGQTPACPHCPPGHAAAADHDEAGAHAAAHSPATHAHAEHSPAAHSSAAHSSAAHAAAAEPGATPHRACAGWLAECANAGEINHHARDTGIEPPAPAASWIADWPDVPRLADADAGGAAPAVRRRCGIAGASPPLNVLYCVYLD